MYIKLVRTKSKKKMELLRLYAILMVKLIGNLLEIVSSIFY